MNDSFFSIGNFISLNTLIKREYKRILRTGKQDLFISLSTVMLYLVIFGKVVGNKIGNTYGINYIDFILPGVLMMVIINNAFNNVLASFFGAKFQRYIEEMLVSPTPSYIIVLGFISGGIMRSIFVGSVVFFSALILMHINIHNIWLTIFISFLTSIIFSLAGLINAIYIKNIDTLFVVPTLILTPLIYLSGVFYPIDSLPIFWQKLSSLNPVSIILGMFRVGILGIKLDNFYSDCLIMVTLIIFLFLYCNHLLKHITQ